LNLEKNNSLLVVGTPFISILPSNFKGEPTTKETLCRNVSPNVWALWLNDLKP
jgi:hypothetical protein